jgi:hypothetical protein
MDKAKKAVVAAREGLEACQRTGGAGVAAAQAVVDECAAAAEAAKSKPKAKKEKAPAAGAPAASSTSASAAAAAAAAAGAPPAAAAAPAPAPAAEMKLRGNSIWNTKNTWEEQNLTNWAMDRLQVGAVTHPSRLFCRPPPQTRTHESITTTGGRVGRRRT